MARPRRTAGELRLAIEIKQDELRAFRREHRGWFREGLHEQVDRIVEEARQRYDVLASRGITADGIPPLDSPGRVSALALDALWRFVHNAELHADWHARIDALPADAFPALSRAQAERRDDELASEIAKLEAELREVERQAAHAVVDQQFASRP